MVTTPTITGQLCNNAVYPCERPASQMTSTQGKTPPFSFRFPLAFLILFCILLIGEGCSGPFLYSRTIHEGRNKYVKLEARYGDGQRGANMEFSHPVSLSETDWARILKTTYVKPQQRLFIETKEVGPTPLFSESELQYLVKYVTVAFTKAHPGEWVVFYVCDPQGTPVPEITSGGLFVEDSKLHFMLAETVEAGKHRVVAHCAVGLIFTGKGWKGLGFLHHC